MVSWAYRIDDMTKKLITRVEILRDRDGDGDTERKIRLGSETDSLCIFIMNNLYNRYLLNYIRGLAKVMFSSIFK